MFGADRECFFNPRDTTYSSDRLISRHRCTRWAQTKGSISLEATGVQPGGPHAAEAASMPEQTPPNLPLNALIPATALGSANLDPMSVD